MLSYREALKYNKIEKSQVANRIVFKIFIESLLRNFLWGGQTKVGKIPDFFIVFIFEDFPWAFIKNEK